MYRHPFWNSRIVKNCRKSNDILKSMIKVLTPTAQARRHAAPVEQGGRNGWYGAAQVSLPVPGFHPA